MDILFIVLVVLVVFGIAAAGTLLFALPWYLFYSAKGKPDLRDTGSLYSEHLTFCGAVSFCVTAVSVLIFCAVGQNLTARMGDRIGVHADRGWWAGDYVRTYRDSLPEANRRYLDSDDMLFISTVKDSRGQLKVMKIEGADLLRQIGSAHGFRLVEGRWTYRYPAKLFKWMGPITEKPEFTIQIEGGQEKVVTGISWRTSVKS